MPKKSGLETPQEVEIGARVKRFRDQINWPQPAFALELGISRDRLASIEYGRTPLRYAIGYRLCFIFDVNHHWLATGEGEVKGATAALELPRPESTAHRALFSGICAPAKSGRSAGHASKGRGGAKPKDGQLIPNFDPTAHVVGFLGDLFAKEKFKSPLERQEFALEITSYARELALRIRREGAKERYLSVPKTRGAEVSGRNTSGASKLEESVRRVGQELAKLNAAMKKPTGSGSPGSAPPSAEMETARLQDAIDKIAAQIADAATSLRILNPQA